jgi:hypothetical protein
MAHKTRARSQSGSEDNSPEDILAEKYRSADGVCEVDPSEITSATRVNRMAAGAQAAQFPEEQHCCFAVIGACIRDRSAREERVGLQKCGQRRREAWWTRRARDTWESQDTCDRQRAGRGELVFLAVEESWGERSGPRDRDGKYLGAGVHVELDLIGV